MRTLKDVANIDGNCEFTVYIDGEHICTRTGTPCTHLDENGVPSPAFRCAEAAYMLPIDNSEL